MININKILKMAKEKEASDVHLIYNLKPNINTKSRIGFNDFKWFICIQIHTYTQIYSKLFL